MINITLKLEEWQQIVDVLVRAPFHIAAPLIEQIRTQASAPASSQIGPFGAPADSQVSPFGAMPNGHDVIEDPRP